MIDFLRELDAKCTFVTPLGLAQLVETDLSGDRVIVPAANTGEGEFALTPSEFDQVGPLMYHRLRGGVSVEQREVRQRLKRYPLLTAIVWKREVLNEGYEVAEKLERAIYDLIGQTEIEGYELDALKFFDSEYQNRVDADLSYNYLLFYWSYTETYNPKCLPDCE